MKDIALYLAYGKQLRLAIIILNDSGLECLCYVFAIQLNLGRLVILSLKTKQELCHLTWSSRIWSSTNLGSNVSFISHIYKLCEFGQVI